MVRRGTEAPLRGIRVVEFAEVAAGPMAGQLLAEMGASVDKVEPPRGDRWRTAPPIHEGMSARFYNVNRGKRSIVLDLKDPGDMDVARRLVERSDVVIENWRPGVAHRLGFDWENESHPGLIVLSISGFGDGGPRAGDRAYDPVIQAVSGIAYSQGGPERPTLTASVLTDKLTALVGTQAVLGALIARRRTGSGRYIPLSMLDVAISFSWPDLFGALTFVRETPFVEGETKPPRTSTIARAGDGRFVAFNSLTVDDWRGLCEAAGRIDLFETYRELAVRAHATEEIVAELEKAFRDFDRDTLLQRLRERGVPAGPVNSYKEVLEDPQVLHNGVIREITRDGLGQVREVAPIVGRSLSDGWPGPAPWLGQNTSEVVAELESTEVKSLRARFDSVDHSAVELIEGLCTTRTIRRFRPDDIPAKDLSTILFAATRAPSGGNRQPNRYVILRRDALTLEARKLLGDAFREHWSRKRVRDGYDQGSGADPSSQKARHGRVVQDFVDSIESAPVIVLVCATGVRSGGEGFIDGASVFPACQNLLLAARGLGYGGVLSMWHLAASAQLHAELGIPDDVVIAATIVLGVPRGGHGPVRRLPLREVVYEGEWGVPARWVTDPPGTRFARSGPPPTPVPPDPRNSADVRTAEHFL